MNPMEKHKTEIQLLFVKNTSLIRGFILSLLPDFNMADDVLQEVFLTVTEKAGDFMTGTNFTAWACSIARFKVLEYRRRESRAADVMLSPEAIESLCSAGRELKDDNEDEKKALAGCIEKLAPRSRQIVKLRYNGGRKPSEIARKMSWKPQAVYVALSRSREFLRTCVEKKLGRGVG